MTRSPLELRHLRTLLSLAQTGSLSATAKLVHLSQPAISQQIKVLEDWYELVLFERKSVPLKLSPAGERLLALAKELLPGVAAAERDLSKLRQGEAGQLRIAVECSTCFEWLMPTMDVFREAWPDVELDLISGFHCDPLPLLLDNRADLAIACVLKHRPDLLFHPLFGFEIIGLVSKRHTYADKVFLEPEDFANETLICYPVPDEMLDVVTRFLTPAGIFPPRRTTEMTVGILQLVASRRGIAALPNWSMQMHIDRGYVLGKRIGQHGLFGELYAATLPSPPAYVLDFLQTIQDVSFSTLKGITSLRA